MTQIKYKLIKALMVCLGLEHGAAGWKALMNPLSYGGTPVSNLSILTLVDGTKKVMDSNPTSYTY